MPRQSSKLVTRMNGISTAFPLSLLANRRRSRRHSQGEQRRSFQSPHNFNNPNPAKTQPTPCLCWPASGDVRTPETTRTPSSATRANRSLLQCIDRAFRRPAVTTTTTTTTTTTCPAAGEGTSPRDAAGLGSRHPAVIVPKTKIKRKHTKRFKRDRTNKVQLEEFFPFHCALLDSYTNSG